MNTAEILQNTHDHSMSGISFVEGQLDSFSLEDRAKMIALAARKLRHGGTLAITGQDVLEISKALNKGYISIIEFNSMLRPSLISLEYAENMLEHLGLEVKIKRINNYKFYIEAIRP